MDWIVEGRQGCAHPRHGSAEAGRALRSGSAPGSARRKGCYFFFVFFALV